MSDIFISHVEEDVGIALGIALGLEQARYSTWCYELDSVPGQSYLVMTAQAIEESAALVVLGSVHSLGSRQVTVELVRGHETNKHLIPVLVGITHSDLQKRQPEWRQALGATTSVRLRESKVSDVMPNIITSLRMAGISAHPNVDKKRLAQITAYLGSEANARTATEKHRLTDSGLLASEGRHDSVTTHEATPSDRYTFADMRIVLVVQEYGIDERRLTFDRSSDRRIVIGRSPSCDVVLSSQFVSNKHAMIWFDGEKGWALVDLDSTNGTYLNRRRAMFEAAVIRPGDEIDVGRSLIIVAAHSDEHQDPEP